MTVQLTNFLSLLSDFHTSLEFTSRISGTCINILVIFPSIRSSTFSFQTNPNLSLTSDSIGTPIHSPPTAAPSLDPISVPSTLGTLSPSHLQALFTPSNKIFTRKLTPVRWATGSRLAQCPPSTRSSKLERTLTRHYRLANHSTQVALVYSVGATYILRKMQSIP